MSYKNIDQDYKYDQHKSFLWFSLLSKTLEVKLVHQYIETNNSIIEEFKQSLVYESAYWISFCKEQQVVKRNKSSTPAKSNAIFRSSHEI